MPTILIAYDLAPGSDYQPLHAAIKALGSSWWHHLDSTWLVKTNKSPKEVREQLKPLVGAQSELLVIDVTSRSRAWMQFSERGSKWLKDTYE